LEERNKLLENHTSDETLLQISFLLIHMDEAAENAILNQSSTKNGRRLSSEACSVFIYK
jgi:hypothetical protein